MTDIILCIDVEPNDRQVGGVADEDWSATGPVIALLERTRRSLAAIARRPVHLNWFLRMDPQVALSYGRADFIAQCFPAELNSMRAAGDEIGLHVHAWKQNLAGGWFADHADRDWVRHCVHESWRAYRQAFQRKPRAFRFGDHFLDDDVVRQIDRLGVRYDLTVEPGIEAMPGMNLGEVATGQLPDYKNFPRVAFHPARRDFSCPARWWRRRLWLIPVSTGRQEGPGVASTPDGGPRYYHLNLAGDPVLNQCIFDGLLAQQSDPLIVWVARSGDYAIPEFQRNFESNLRLLAEHPRRADFAFVRPDEAVPR